MKRRRVTLRPNQGSRVSKQSQQSSAEPGRTKSVFGVWDNWIVDGSIDRIVSRDMNGMEM